MSYLNSDTILGNLTENLRAQEGVYTELQTNFQTVFNDFGQLGTELQTQITEILKLKIDATLQGGFDPFIKHNSNQGIKTTRHDRKYMKKNKILVRVHSA